MPSVAVVSGYGVSSMELSAQLRRVQAVRKCKVTGKPCQIPAAMPYCFCEQQAKQVLEASHKRQVVSKEYGDSTRRKEDG